MRKYNSACLLFISILFIAVSCTKEGPEGPAGAQGAQGSPGGSGPAGSAGPQGTTNVTYSPWFLTGTGWAGTDAVANPYLAHWLYDRASTVITQAIMDQGLVLAFMKGEPNTPAMSTQTFALPYSIGNGAGFLDQYEFVLNAPGNIRFLYKSDNPWSPAQLAVISFRYVVIPGSVAGGRGINSITTYEGYTAEQLKAMPYSQVKGLFNIPD